MIGGALAVACYLFVGIAMHRKPDNTTRFWTTACWCRAPCRPACRSGVPVGVPVPADVAGQLAEIRLAFRVRWTDWMRENVIVWLRSLRSTIFSVWLAYTVVWMAYGLRLISSTLLQVGPELEEAARSTGATRGQITRHVTIPSPATVLLVRGC